MTEKILILLVIFTITVPVIGAWNFMHSPEQIAIKCAKWDLTQTFDDCVKDKGCALRSGRNAEWRDWVSFQTNTYNCPRNEK